ncbi:MAG: hypothetical protein AAGJ79_11170 [Verrucomicrobiota bacterium]
MARRSRKKGSPIVPIAVVAGLLILGGVLFAVTNRNSDPFAALTSLPVEDYLENGSSFGGNFYKITAVVDEKLHYSPDGQMISISVDDALVAVFVPPELGNQNITRGDRFTFKVEVKQRGVLHVHDLRKS